MCGRFWGERWRLCPEFHVITVILTVFLRLPSKKGRRLSPPQNIRPYGLFALTALLAVLNTVFTFIQHCSCTARFNSNNDTDVLSASAFSSLFARSIKDRFRPLSYLMNCVFNFTVYRKINYLQTTSTCLTCMEPKLFVSVNNKNSFLLVF